MTDEIDWRTRGSAAAGLLAKAGFDQETMLEQLRAALEELEVHRGEVMRLPFDPAVATQLAVAASGAGQAGPQAAMYDAVRAARLLAWEVIVSPDDA